MGRASRYRCVRLPRMVAVAAPPVNARRPGQPASAVVPDGSLAEVVDAFRARTSGACASLRRTPACPAAPSIGSSTRWRASTCSRRRAGRGRFRAGPPLIRRSLLLADRLDVRAVARPVMERGGGDLDETAVLCLYAPEPAPVLGRRRRRVEPPDPLHLGIAAQVGRPPRRARAARASSRSCPRPSARPSWPRCPTRCPAPRRCPRRELRAELRACPRPWATSSATASGSRGRRRLRRPSATRRAGSWAISCSAGPTTAPTLTRRHRAARLVMDATAQVSAALGYRPEASGNDRGDLTVGHGTDDARHVGWTRPHRPVAGG